MAEIKLLEPLKQSKLGVPSDKIECRSDLQSITKAEDNSTACVTQQAVQTLVKRGWTIETKLPKWPWDNWQVLNLQLVNQLMLQ